nr:peptidylprolyl isomerase [Desulfolutivibrio sulfoxidireducens]
MVRLETSKGIIDIELDKEKAPVTTENFLTYVKEGFYDGLVFHRVINGFMIQGGGMDESMKEKKTHGPIKNEADNGLKNDAYTVAMARTMDPDSATAQFFINVADNDFLNHTAKTPQGWGYAVFGKVVNGKAVVDAIKGLPTMTKGFHENVPVMPIKIVKAEVVEE